MDPISFQTHDEVMNPARPEWGIGKILSIEPGQGKCSVRIRVNFSGAGVKTITIPPGQLVRPQEQCAGIGGSEANSGQTNESRLQTLPAQIGDRKIPWQQRLCELVKLFQFGEDARGAFDWAVYRLQCSDPLGEFTADELKAYFQQMRKRRDQALGDLYRQARLAGEEREFRAILDRGCDVKTYQAISSLLPK